MTRGSLSYVLWTIVAGGVLLAACETSDGGSGDSRDETVADVAADVAADVLPEALAETMPDADPEPTPEPTPETVNETVSETGETAVACCVYDQDCPAGFDCAKAHGA